MCSIGGWIAPKPLTPWESERLARALLFFGSERGKQSGGIWANGICVKAAVTPHHLSDRADYQAAFKDGAALCLTHTRQPTMGGTGDAQAQPFIHGDTVSVHNGCFSNCKELRERFNLNKPSGVDSELVAEFVDAHGIGELAKFLSAAQGSAACAIVHKGELYLARTSNPLETLTVTWANGDQVTVFASTERILMQAIRHVWLVGEDNRSVMMTYDTIAKLAPNGKAEPLAKVERSFRVVKASDSGRNGMVGSMGHVGHTTSFPSQGASHGTGVSKWEPRPRRRYHTKKQEAERKRLIGLLKWPDDSPADLSLVRHAAKRKGIALKEIRPDMRAVDSYYKKVQDNKIPTEQEIAAYLDWCDAFDLDAFD